MTLIRFADNKPELSRLVAEEFFHVVRKTLSHRKSFSLALCGGKTPRPFYKLLTHSPYRDKVPWSRVHVFWGDERFVPLDNPQSNYRLARNTLLSKITIPPQNIHPVPVQLPDVEQAAAAYERDLRRFFGRVTVPRFDLILLGMGEDGHVASLFPGRSAVHERRRWVLPVRKAPKLPSDRVTLSLPVITDARSVFVLVNGREKCKVAARVLSGEGRSLPAGKLRSLGDRLIWFVDQAVELRRKVGVL